MSRYTAATLTQFANAVASVRADKFSPAEEALADQALLALFKLRDHLVHRNANALACRVDEQMEAVERLARGAVQ